MILQARAGRKLEAGQVARCCVIGHFEAIMCRHGSHGRIARKSQRIGTEKLESWMIKVETKADVLCGQSAALLPIRG